MQQFAELEELLRHLTEQPLFRVSGTFSSRKQTSAPGSPW